jgi:hypothetical protein
MNRTKILRRGGLRRLKENINNKNTAARLQPHFYDLISLEHIRAEHRIQRLPHDNLQRESSVECEARHTTLTGAQ